MAIQGIKSGVMSPVSRTESMAAENTSVSTVAAAQETGKKMAAQGSGNKTTGQEKQQEAVDSGQALSEVSEEKIKAAVAEINQKIRPTRTQCEFRYHEETHRISIKVKDSETDEVIREIPPEKTLDMIAKTLELAGLLVDEKR